MADVVDIGGAAGQVKSSDRFAPFTQVVLQNDAYDAGEAKEYTVGSTANGRSLTVQCPWADENIASRILSELNGTTYQPYTASGAVIDPAVELGDDLSVMGLTGRIFAQDISFGGVMRSDIGAPGEEEIDHEFHFEVKRERKIAHAFTSAGGGIRKNAQEILERREELIAALTGADDAPEDLSAGFQGYVRYDLENNEGYAASQLFAQIGDTAVARVQTSSFVDVDGNARSMVDIVADSVLIAAKAVLLGLLSVEGNNGIHADGPITSSTRVLAPAITVTNGVITMGASEYGAPPTLGVSGGGIVISGISYAPEGITSYNPTDKSYAVRKALGHK